VIRQEEFTMNTIAYFEIQSSNPEREASFYRTVFGWKISKDVSMPIEYYRIETDDIQGALLERPADVVPMSGTNAFTCSIEVANFDETAKIILANGGISGDLSESSGQCPVYKPPLLIYTIETSSQGRCVL
jgi:predicted enzyme related to lactoylglutathione lyase